MNIMNLTKVEFKDDKGVKWSCMGYDFQPNQYTFFRNGGDGFSLELKDGSSDEWLVFNGSPDIDQYESRDAYVRALARTDHQMPLIARLTMASDDILAIMKWAIEQYKEKGWTEDDPFGEKLTRRAVPA
jgi:hypothetical protein